MEMQCKAIQGMTWKRKTWPEKEMHGISSQGKEGKRKERQA